MVSQVQEETYLENQEIQGTILSERGFPENKNPEPLNSYSPVVQWTTVRLMLILQCIIGLHSQSIYFKNSFSRADIPSG